MDDYTSIPVDFDEREIPTAKAPFGYYGAKQRLASSIIKSLPPHNAWVEAFCGSAAITLAKEAAPIEVINDLDGQIINLFDQLRNNTEELCRAVALTPYARDEFNNARKSDPGDCSPLEKARKFLVATMMTVNATYGSSGCGFSYSQSYARSGKEARVNRWYNLPDRIMKVVERLRNVRVENRDARDLIKSFIDRPATLIYLDPPYFTKRQHNYVIDANDKPFHEELLNICCESKSMILLSGYANELYDSILTDKTGWGKTFIETHTGDTTGKKYSRTEVLWKNKYYIKAEQSGEIPIVLTAKEKKEKKINPPRK